MPINDRVKSMRSVLRRTPAYSIISVLEEDGKVVFLNTVTNEKFDTFQKALIDADLLKIADHRVIDSLGTTTTGRIVGAAVNANRVVRINRYLSDAANADELRRQGLGHLVNASVSGRVFLFDVSKGQTEEKKVALKRVSDTIQSRLPGESFITDDGIQLFSLSQTFSDGSSVMISSAEQQLLQQLAGSSIFPRTTIADFFADVGTAVHRISSWTCERSTFDGQASQKITVRIFS